MSLLGRPLNYRASRRDARYRRLQSRIYNFLERPRGFAILYHMIVFLIVLTCLTLSVFSTISEYETTAGNILTFTESFVLVWFGVEFGFRVWSSGCRSRYQGYLGRLKFLKSPFCIIDIITILASIITMIYMALYGTQTLPGTALRALRFFQILRMVRMDRRGGTWKLLGSVVYAHRQELITTLYIGFLGLIFASFLVFLAEKDVNKKFSNFAQALWWGVITLCTVGYGDMVPETWPGKIIASFCALLGISFFALPAGILGSGFALKVQQQQRQKHMIRRRQPAAMLIQSLWRCYAADEQSMSIATWKIHQIPQPSPPSRVSSSFKHNASFVSRLPTIRRHKSTSLHSPSTHKNATQRSGRSLVDINASEENLDKPGLKMYPYKLGAGSSSTANGNRNLNASHSEDSVAETMVSKRNSDDEEEEPRYIQLTNQHKSAIRAIRKLKYFVARKKFREALKPYDVKDVIEQYSSGHADLLNRRSSISSDIIFNPDLKAVLMTVLLRSLDNSRFKVRVKDQLLIVSVDVFNSHFKDAIMVSLSLDQILGKQGSKAKDVYASKISLASRVVKVERQVDDIETKIDQLIELYIDDRKRFMPYYFAHHSTPDRSNVPVGSSAPLPTSALKPKPILVDKQSSEPSSPITRFREPPQVSVTRIPMHRGYSDLGNRIKKRVTLSAPYDGEVVIVVPPPPTSSTSAGQSSASTSTAIELSDFSEGNSRTGGDGSDNLDRCQEEDENDQEEEDDEDMEESQIEIEEEEIDVPNDGEEEDEEDDANETSLLCPPKTEIIITPMTLSCPPNREAYSETFNMTHLKPNRNVKEDV
ncbi:unnamed protein product [Brassicogethes aeneus]|uniref:Uncharacterized protein n=1 Tax=Brassicogethes aeneus TaxID=1431903 RepID=A0A9P0BEQ9_BRAAE|nr:unnamed protein product [Brassicogethes aeneus]